MDNLYGINPKRLKENYSVTQLINEAVRRGDGILADNGCLLIETGQYTGRSPKDRFVVDDEVSHDTVGWGKVNVPITQEVYAHMKAKVLDYIKDRDLYLIKSRVGANKEHTMRINVLAENATQAVFASQIFIKDREREGYEADFTVIAVPALKSTGKDEGMNSEAFVIISLKDRLVLIGGTYYSGEIKKSIFSVMNYLMPQKGILPMHCSANMSEDHKTALFFGLSGTGKTTLSADESRKLIGDDEHGWSDTGIFNFEGGCYAKTINLDPEKEKEIFGALRFGSLLENVVVDEDLHPDYYNDRLTENTRGTYPVEYIPNAELCGEGGIPQTVVFLTADAFGVIPPISRLTKEGAMYHFMSGYTSKLAGTERGITEPQTTFSALFGEPFMLRPIEEYARLLGEKIDRFNTEVYLINTGWTGGAYGVGKRMSLPLTRRMVNAAINGDLRSATYRHDDIFNLDVPEHIEGVPDAVLNPKTQWADQAAYEKTAKDLAAKFQENFHRFPEAGEDIVKAGPRNA
ncbi:Phosphoenolpyruvate carboxykinase [ATP] [Clostridiaceae bacterium JG1575]|nr:Phosphoenolpyruvate carboxykinase [ATP] [Clostridiaceae bacterium JG1575]